MQMEKEPQQAEGRSGRFAPYWHWCYVPLVLGFLVAVAMVLRPPWRCYVGSGRYRVSPWVGNGRAIGTAVRDDFPPNRPMAVCSHQYYVRPRYAWLFAPPRQVRGRPVRAEIDWERLGPRVAIALLITIAATALVAKMEGRRRAP